MQTAYLFCIEEKGRIKFFGWLISSAEDFIAMNEWIKYDVAYAKGYYKMTADIDFEGTIAKFELVRITTAQ